MTFNASKTTTLFFSRAIEPFPISFCGHNLEYSENHKHLGFIINNTLDFDPQEIRKGNRKGERTQSVG
jgi:hypothetical protein